jgi:hypothetical protein
MVKVRKEKQPGHQSPESPAGKSPLVIPYDPVSLEELIRRARRVKEIVAEIEEAGRVPSELMRRQFDI